MDPLIRWVRAIGAQLIVFHHFALYGPMSGVVYHLAPGPFDWLVEHARIAVQVFLVMGGFLAARLLAQPAAGGVFASLGRRYLRLARPYWVALLLALVAARVARLLIVHPDAPPPASAWQVVANFLMLQDIVGAEALSAGVWYVAIDLQLFALMLLIAKVCGTPWPVTGRPAPAARAVVLLLTPLSLLWISRTEGLDIWAPYFFGAYGLGIIAAWARDEPARRWLWRALIVGLSVAALLLQWRSRVLLAGSVALALSFDFSRLRLPVPVPRALDAAVRHGAEVSYELFLLHYPVLLLVGALVSHGFPASIPANAAGLLLAWLLSLSAAGWLHQRLHPFVGTSATKLTLAQ